MTLTLNFSGGSRGSVSTLVVNHINHCGKYQKDLWQVWDPNSLQRRQHHQEPPGLPKDKDPMVSQSDAIYWYQCGDPACDNEYIGETSRTFGERYKEHLKDPSPIHHHNNQTNHPINHINFKIIGREGHHLSRYIKESIFIRVNNPTLNNNVGKYNLPHIWHRVLTNTPGLKSN